MTARGRGAIVGAISALWAGAMLCALVTRFAAPERLPPPDPCIARVHALRIQLRAQQALISRMEWRTDALAKCWEPIESYLRVVAEESAP